MGRKARGGSRRMAAMAAGLLVGGACALAGIQCLEPGTEGTWRIRAAKALRHASGLFLGSGGITLFAGSYPGLFGWIEGLGSKGTTLSAALLAAFILGVLSRRGSLTLFLPGFRTFLCPQCFHKSVFRFQPVSLKFGLFVTYLCGRCSCLVDAWGNQVLSFLPVSGKDLPGLLVKTAWFSVLSVASGILAGWWLSRWFV